MYKRQTQGSAVSVSAAGRHIHESVCILSVLGIVFCVGINLYVIIFRKMCIRDSLNLINNNYSVVRISKLDIKQAKGIMKRVFWAFCTGSPGSGLLIACLLYTSRCV